MVGNVPDQNPLTLTGDGVREGDGGHEATPEQWAALRLAVLKSKKTMLLCTLDVISGSRNVKE